MNASAPDGKCRYPLSHRDKHGRKGWCSCLCHRPVRHIGKHRCEVELAAETEADS